MSPSRLPGGHLHGISPEVRDGETERERDRNGERGERQGKKEGERKRKGTEGAVRERERAQRCLRSLNPSAGTATPTRFDRPLQGRASPCHSLQTASKSGPKGS